MRYLLDTNVLSDLVRNPRGRVAQRIREVGEAQVCTSIIVAAELRYGAAKGGSRRLSAQLEAVLGAPRCSAFRGASGHCLRRAPRAPRTGRQGDRRQRSADRGSGDCPRLRPRDRQRARVCPDRQLGPGELAASGPMNDRTEGKGLEDSPPPKQEDTPVAGTQKAPTADGWGLTREAADGRQPRLELAAPAHPGWRQPQPVLSFELLSFDRCRS